MSKQIHVGSVPVGGGADIAIQSMCNTRTEDVAATVAQILRLEEAGCDIVRVAVPDMAAAQAVGRIRRAAKIRRRHPGGAGGECHGPCPPAERLQFRRHLHLREVLPCAGEHGGLSAAAPTDGLPPASGSHRGGYAPDGGTEIRHRHRRPAVSGHRRHHSGEPHRRPGGIAGGDGEGLVFRKGEILYKVPQDKLVDALMDEIDRL